MKLSSYLLVASLSGLCLTTQAQNKTPAAEVKKQLEEANQKVKDSAKQMADAQKKLQQSEAARQSATAKEQKLALDVEQKQATDLGYADAAAALQQAQTDLDTVRKSLVTALKTSSDYQSATRDAQAASDKLKEVREDTSLSAGDRERKTSELSNTIRRPADMEHARVENSPQLKAAQDKVGEAQKKVNDIRQKIALAVQQDSGVQGAVAEVKKAAADSDAARKEYTDAQKTHANAENQAARDERIYQQAQNASKTKRKY